MQLSKSRDVDACLFAVDVLDLGKTQKGSGKVRGGPCSLDRQDNDGSRFDLMKRGVDFGR